MMNKEHIDKIKMPNKSSFHDVSSPYHIKLNQDHIKKKIFLDSPICKKSYKSYSLADEEIRSPNLIEDCDEYIINKRGKNQSCRTNSNYKIKNNGKGSSSIISRPSTCVSDSKYIAKCTKRSFGNGLPYNGTDLNNIRIDSHSPKDSIRHKKDFYHDNSHSSALDIETLTSDFKYKRKSSHPLFNVNKTNRKLLHGGRTDDNLTFITANTSEPDKNDLEEWWSDFENYDKPIYEKKLKEEGITLAKLLSPQANKMLENIGNSIKSDAFSTNNLNGGESFGKKKANYLSRLKIYIIKLITLILLITLISTPLLFVLLPKFLIYTTFYTRKIRGSLASTPLWSSSSNASQKFTKNGDNFDNYLFSNIGKIHKMNHKNKVNDRRNLRDYITIQRNSFDPQEHKQGLFFRDFKKDQTTSNNNLWPKIIPREKKAFVNQEQIISFSLNCERRCQDTLLLIFFKYFPYVMLISAIYLKQSTRAVTKEYKIIKTGKVNALKKLFRIFMTPFKLVYKRLPPTLPYRFDCPRWPLMDYNQFCFSMLTISLLSIVWLYYILLIVNIPNLFTKDIRKEYSYTDVVFFANSILDFLIYLHIGGVVYFKSLCQFKKTDTRLKAYSVKCVRSNDGATRIYQLIGPCSIQNAAVKLLDFYHRDFGIHNPRKYYPNMLKHPITNSINTQNAKYKSRENERQTKLNNINETKSKGLKNSQSSCNDVRRELTFYNLIENNGDFKFVANDGNNDYLLKKKAAFQSAKWPSITNSKNKLNNTGLKNEVDDNIVCDNTEIILPINEIVSHNERYYEEEEYKARVRRRRARLQTSAEAAFSMMKASTTKTVLNKDHNYKDFDKLYVKAENENKSSMNFREMAHSIFPLIVKNMQKYLRVTKQQMFYSIKMIMEHLANCIKFEMGPNAFTELYFNEVNKIHNVKMREKIEEWMIIAEKAVSEDLNDDMVFQLQHKDIKLLFEIKSLPKYIIHEYSYNFVENFVMKSSENVV